MPKGYIKIIVIKHKVDRHAACVPVLSSQPYEVTFKDYSSRDEYDNNKTK